MLGQKTYLLVKKPTDYQLTQVLQATGNQWRILKLVREIK